MYSGYKEGSDEYQELYADVIETMEESTKVVTVGNTENIFGQTEPSEGNAMLKIDFAALQEINPDVVGWIDIPGLKISYPVVQAEDNQYYLNKTFRKENNIAGSIYMDFRNQADMSDRNTIIHGHNMKNRTMFGNLKKYGEEGVAEANTEFYFYIPEKIYRCEVISYRTVRAITEEYPVGFATKKEFNEFVQRAVQNSWYDFLVETEEEDRIITLSTCTSNDTSRFVVQARLVEMK